MSKNSSYLTWTNTALTATAVGAGVGGYLMSNENNASSYIKRPQGPKPADLSTVKLEDSLSQQTSWTGNAIGSVGGFLVGAELGSIIGQIAGPAGRVAGGMAGAGLGTVAGTKLAAAAEGKEVPNSTTRTFTEGAGGLGGMYAGWNLGKSAGPATGFAGSLAGGMLGHLAGSGTGIAIENTMKNTPNS